MTLILDVACWLLAALFAWLAIGASLGLMLAPPLRKESDEPESLDPIHVVVPVRNEQDRIGQTVQRLLAQRGVSLTITVVDDRSDDETPQILAGLSARDPRLRVVRIDSLPDGWLGKCHACHVGARSADAPWLLFMDADTWLVPDAIRLALGRAQRTGACMLCLMPGFAHTTFWGRAALLGAMNAFMARVARTSLDLAGGYIGVGAFNLVRTKAYVASGGHETLRLEVVDDVALGLLVRRTGGSVRVSLSPSHAEVDWGGSVRSLVQVLEKNGWAAVGFRWLPALLVAIGGAIATALALLSPLSMLLGLKGGLALFLAWIAGAIPAVIASGRLRWPRLSAFVTPLTYPILSAALLNSVQKTSRAGGVRWRETLYPLSELREAWARVRKKPQAADEPADTMR